MMKMWSKSYIMRGTRAWKTFSEMIINFIFFLFLINVQVHGSRDSQHNLVNSLMQDLINEGKTIQCMYYVLDPGKKYHNDECILPIINIDYKTQRCLTFPLNTLLYSIFGYILQFLWLVQMLLHDSWSWICLQYKTIPEQT